MIDISGLGFIIIILIYALFCTFYRYFKSMLLYSGVEHIFTNILILHKFFPLCVPWPSYWITPCFPFSLQYFLLLFCPLSLASQSYISIFACSVHYRFLHRFSCLSSVYSSLDHIFRPLLMFTFLIVSSFVTPITLNNHIYVTIHDP